MQHLEDNSLKLITEIFSLIKNSHHFYNISSTFWDSENNLNEKYKKKLFEINTTAERKNELEKSYNVLMNTKVKDNYLNYLKFQYIMSQPKNLYEFENHYYSIIYPFYLFPLFGSDFSFMIIDNVNFTLKFYNKDTLNNSLEITQLLDIKIEG